jgi:DNA-binding MarR family transcriptional regulator
MAAWREFLTAATTVTDALDRELQAAFGRSLAEYEILVHLSEAPDRRRRMTELADLALLSRSRLTRTIDRLVNADLVVREPCDDDRRGIWAVLTDEGFSVLEAMAPVHVAGVRAHLLDALARQDLAPFAAMCRRVVNHPSRH